MNSSQQPKLTSPFSAALELLRRKDIELARVLVRHEVTTLPPPLKLDQLLEQLDRHSLLECSDGRASLLVPLQKESAVLVVYRALTTKREALEQAMDHFDRLVHAQQRNVPVTVPYTVLQGSNDTDAFAFLLTSVPSLSESLGSAIDSVHWDNHLLRKRALRALARFAKCFHARGARIAGHNLLNALLYASPSGQTALTTFDINEARLGSALPEDEAGPDLAHMLEQILTATTRGDRVRLLKHYAHDRDFDQVTTRTLIQHASHELSTLLAEQGTAPCDKELSA